MVISGKPYYKQEQHAVPLFKKRLPTTLRLTSSSTPTMTDEELLLKTSSSTYMSLESNPVIDSTTPPVDTTHPNNPAGVGEKIEMVIESTLQHKESTLSMEESSSQTPSTGDEPIALQDSPVALNSQEVSKETALQIEPDMTEMDNNNLPEPSALDGNAADDGLDFSYDKSGYSQDTQAEEEQAEGVPNELSLTASEGPRPHGGLAKPFEESQPQERTRSSRLSPVQIESHLLSPEDQLTSSPTTSNPNTPDSPNQMAGDDNVMIGTGGDADTETNVKTAAKPVADEALPNPFEFIPPSSLLGVPSQPRTPVSSLSNRSGGNVQRLPSVLRPANRHAYDTEGVRRASMVAGWDFAPPTLFAATAPENEYSPRYRTVSLEGIRSDSYSIPSRPQSSASWYPQYHRINSQPVYVDTVSHSHLQPHHQRLSTQPAYLNGSGSSSFADFAETPDFRLSTPGVEQQQVGDEQSEVTASVPVNEAETGMAKEQGNENTMEEHDKACTTDQSKQQRWKFWSRNKQPTCPPNNTRAEKTKSVVMPAETRLKLKKRLSRNLLKKTN